MELNYTFKQNQFVSIFYVKMPNSLYGYDSIKLKRQPRSFAAVLFYDKQTFLLFSVVAWDKPLLHNSLLLNVNEDKRKRVVDLNAVKVLEKALEYVLIVKNE